MTISDPQAVTVGDQMPRTNAFEQNQRARTSLEPSQQDWVNVFGPAGMDVKLDRNRFNRYNRVHLPDVLKGPNQFLTDRIDGLITDTTNSPYTTLILPYQ